MKKTRIIPGLLVLSAVLVGCGTEKNPVAVKINNDELRINYKQVRKNAGNSDTPSTGEAKILVLPVDLSDFPAENLPGGKDAVRQDIEDTFFGEAESTSWESFKTFHKKSSFGNLDIGGEVLPWYRPSLSGKELADLARKSGATAAAAKVANDYLLDRKMNHGENHKDLDSDADGYIDGLFMVYSAPIRAKGTNGASLNDDFFWAFKSQTSNSASVNNPFAHNFMWASYEFIYEAGYYDSEDNYVDYNVGDPTLPERISSNTIKPDAHTFIHETGHMMGINDFYSYDTGNGDWSAMGGLDMMDNNVGDHNAYTKWNYGWTSPYHVRNEGEFTLKSYSDTGEFMIIDPNWDNNQTTEYLMIEYYTPTNLFEHDARLRYANSYPQFYKIPGVRVIHVDARLGSFTYNDSHQRFVLNNYVDYTAPMTSGNSPTKVDVVAQNSTSRTGNPAQPDWKELHLLESSGENSLKKLGGRATANESMLFQVGQSFGYDTFTNFTFNDGSVIDFKFEITAMNENGVTIKFEKN